jgi:hypothetical protein
MQMAGVAQRAQVEEPADVGRAVPEEQ